MPEVLGKYYFLPARKVPHRLGPLDDVGIPLFDLRHVRLNGPPVYHPLVIMQYALTQHGLWLDGNLQAEETFMRCARWLEDNAVPEGKSDSLSGPLVFPSGPRSFLRRGFPAWLKEKRYLSWHAPFRGQGLLGLQQVAQKRHGASCIPLAKGAWLPEATTVPASSRRLPTRLPYTSLMGASVLWSGCSNIFASFPTRKFSLFSKRVSRGLKICFLHSIQ